MADNHQRDVASMLLERQNVVQSLRRQLPGWPGAVASTAVAANQALPAPEGGALGTQEVLPAQEGEPAVFGAPCGVWAGGGFEGCRLLFVPLFVTTTVVGSSYSYLFFQRMSFVLSFCLHVCCESSMRTYALLKIAVTLIPAKTTMIGVRTHSTYYIT